MTPDPTSRQPRYQTLRDYLRVFRQYRVPIVVVAVIGAALGFLDAKTQTPTYQGSATISFQDPTLDLNLAGLGSNAVTPPAQLAATEAQTITRPAVVDAVGASVHELPSTVAGSISAQVSQASSLLTVDATSTNPSFASKLANTTARVLVQVDNQSIRSQFATAAATTRRRIAALKGISGTSASPGANRQTMAQLAVYQDLVTRLDALSQFAQTAAVAEPATVPTVPISPKTVRSTIIGLILGLLLAIAFAFVRDSMDRRLRSAADIEESLHLPVLGHIREQVMGKIAQTANGGGDYVPDVEAFRILRRNLQFLNLGRPPRSILVTSAIPEEGKTTVAASLAYAMAVAGNRTLLVDCDLRRPALAKRMAVDASPGLSEYLGGEVAPQDILRQIELRDPNANGSSTNGKIRPSASGNLVLIPAGTPTSMAAELLGSDRFTSFLAEVMGAYDIVILDSSPLLVVADTLEMLPLVGGVVLCARAFRTTRNQATAAKAALSRVPDRPTGVVITGVKPRRDDVDAYSYAYNYVYH